MTLNNAKRKIRAKNAKFGLKNAKFVPKNAKVRMKMPNNFSDF